MAGVLISTQGTRTSVMRVDPGPVEVPWAENTRAMAVPGGVDFERADDGAAVPGPIEYGGAVSLKGIPTSCHEAVQHFQGTPAIRMGCRMETASEVMARVFHRIAIYAPAPEAVLLLGESGTGKELAAKAIHDIGRGSRAPFVVVNMAAIPADLAEAELFGWVRGAFTGATESRAGAFEVAGEGTLFLDEIGDASPAIQAKVLRAVESGFVVRLGSRKPIQTRARIVAATNRDMSMAVSGGSFRLDLLQRLSCLVLRLPPLRERTEDIGIIADLFCRDLPRPPRLTPDARVLLTKHSWPGNARELRNVIIRASLCAPRETLTGPVVAESLAASPFKYDMAGSVRRDDHVIPARVSRGHQIALSGLPRSTFYYRLKRGRIAVA